MGVSRVILLAGTALCAPAAVAQAPLPNTLPTGGAVLAGQASITAPAQNRMTITQGSDRAVIGWQSFSIGSNAGVEIRQPGSGSISVQQVQGNDPSRIFGSLSSNGRVVIANPAGVWFGPEARVDAAGIVAGAGRMSQGAIGQFMADGQVRLDQPAAPGAQVVNEGRIAVSQGGLAALVGPTARNSGTIDARLGRVQIAGGEAATIDFDGDGLISVRAAPGALAENTGRISADGGRVRLSVGEAKGVLAGAVNLGGVVEARSVSADQGGIILGAVQAEAPSVTVTGRVDVSGQRGGTVSLLGETVTVRQGARIDASGAEGGGSIRVGGDARGAAGTRTARTTRVEQGATLSADATIAGPGGLVVVWADEAASFAGTITARGAGAGEGGFAEVSGRLALSYDGTADLTAPSGAWGTLLLDPTVITIVSSGGTNTIPSPSTPGAVNLNASAVVAALASANVTLEATNDIDVAAPIAWSSAGTLRLVAGNAITLASPVTASGTGGLVLRADADGNGLGTAAIRANVSLTSGTLDVQGAAVSVGRTVSQNLAVTTTSGAIRLAATAGSVDIGTTAASNSNTRVASTGGGAITLTARDDVVVRGTTSLSPGTGTWSRVSSDQGFVFVQAGRDVILRSRAGAAETGDSFGRIFAATGMTVTAGRDVLVGTGTGATANAASAASNMLETRAGTQTIRAERNIIVQAGGPNAASRIASGGSQTISAGGRIDVFAGGSAALVTAAGAQSIAASVAITLRGSDSGAFGAEIVNAGGVQTISAGQVRLWARSGQARIENSGGDQALSGGAVRIEGGSGGRAVVLNSAGNQTVSATAGALLLLGGAGGPAGIANSGGAQTISAATGLELTAGAGPAGNASILNVAGLNAAGVFGAGPQVITAPSGITLSGAGGSAFVIADGGPQRITTDGTLTLAAAPGATALGLSHTAPTGAPTPGSASIQSFPRTDPGVAAGAADQTVIADAIAFAGAPGAAAIGLQDWRAINDSPTAAPRYQSVLSGGLQISRADSATVFALLPPPGPPEPPPGNGGTPTPPPVTDPTAGAFRLLTAGAPPQPVAEALAAGTGGFTPAGLAEGEGFQPASVEIEGEDPAAVFANTVLATRVDGLLPPPVPYFAGYVPPPARAPAP